MRHCFFSIIFALFSFVSSAQWQEMPNPGGAEILKTVAEGQRIYCIANGYANLFVSDNGGVRWHPWLATNLPFSPTDIDVQNGAFYAIVDNKFMYTSDDGQSWQDTLTLPGSHSIYRFQVAGDTAYIRGDNFIYVLDLNTHQFTQIFEEPLFSYVYMWAKPGGKVWTKDYFSQNGGQTWDTIPQSWGQIYSMDFKGSDSIIASTTLNYIQFSSDDGATWSTISYPFPSSIPVNTQLIDNQLIAFYYNSFNSASLLYRYNWQAGTWVKIAESPMGFRGYSIVSTGTAWVSQDYEGFVRSTDQGMTWVYSNSGLFRPDDTRNIFSDGNMLFSGYTNACSSDGGQSWVAPLNPPVIVVGRRAFRQMGSRTYAAFYGDSIAYTEGDCLNWTRISPSLSDPYEPFFFGMASGQLIYATKFGRVKRSFDGGVTWEEWGALMPDNNGGTRDFVVHRGKLFFSTVQNQLYRQNADGGIQLMADYEWTQPGYFYNEMHRLFADDKFLVRMAGAWLYISTDEGVNWTEKKVFPDAWTDMILSDMVSTQAGYFTSYANKVYYTPDLLLVDWGQIPSLPNNAGINSIAAAQGYLYVTDETGRIWRFDTRLLDTKGISGKVCKDLNLNGQCDPGEPPLRETLIRSRVSKLLTQTAPDGTFTAFARPAGDTLELILPGHLVAVPAMVVVDSSSAAVGFAVQYPVSGHDLCIEVTALTPFVPGFASVLYVDYTNLGLNAMSGTVQVILPDFMEILSASPPPDMQTGNTLNWNFTSLAAEEIKRITLKVKTPATTGIGTDINVSASVSPFPGDWNAKNNGSRWTLKVVGSFDPNDKHADPEYYTPDSLFNRAPLKYTIRFQNTGNYPASFVRIADTLSPALDWTSLQVLSASHPLKWSLRSDGVLEFLFDPISLPDSFSNEPASHGYVKYAVRPRDEAMPGDTLLNTAHIYFDFNAPVVTNTVRNIIQEFVKTWSPVLSGKLSLQPNPVQTGSALQLRIPHETQQPGRLTVFNAAGQTVLTINRVSGRSLTFNIPAHWAPGVYFLVLKNADAVYSASAVVR